MSNPCVKVLDSGYVKLIEHWGSDERIIEAARMSTGKGFVDWETDIKLLTYLWKNKHLTPFEMCGAIFEIKAPIFIFREWHRHRTQSYNEMSARYIPLPNENYVPTTDRLMHKSSTNKQAQGQKLLSSIDALEFYVSVRKLYEDIESFYQEALNLGVPKELARIVLPVGRYSAMRASANLRNWLQFLTLRDDSHAQWEIQQYAKVVKHFLTELFPRTLQLFEEGRKEE